MTKYTTFDPEVPKTVEYRSIKLPYKFEEKPKVLIIVDAMPHEYETGLLHTGISAELFASCIKEAKRQYPKLKTLHDYDYLFINFNCTVDPKVNIGRIYQILQKVRFEHIWVFSASCYKELKSKILPPYNQIEYMSSFGIPIEFDIDTVKYKGFNNPGIDRLFEFTYGERGGNPYLIGYFIRCLANTLHGDRIWRSIVDHSKIKSVYIDTIDKFDRMIRYLKKFKHAAIDTETDGIEKVQVKMVSIQFSVTPNLGFFVPFYHFDTPFDAEELQYIKEQLNEYLDTLELAIFFNTNFDLNVIRVNLERTGFLFDTYDIADAEYAMDENLTLLKELVGQRPGYYRLGNVAIQYGFLGYIEGKFKKEDRAFIKDVRLTADVIRYGNYDVCSLIALKDMQMKRASYFKYDKFYNLVTKQLSGTQKAFSEMNNTGMLIDKAYLWSLDSTESIFKIELKQNEDFLMSLPEIKDAEVLIRAKSKMPNQGL
ncbi:MAG: hypothetical protein NTZ16_16355, partial [Verrucomicrobia bacterium]|nr:hypothetical protein [Verrucomicrobiota bacterium]